MQIVERNWKCIIYSLLHFNDLLLLNFNCLIILVLFVLCCVCLLTKSIIIKRIENKIHWLKITENNTKLCSYSMST